MGISSDETSLQLLPSEASQWHPSMAISAACPSPLWSYPPLCPCSTGLPCPTMLYRTKLAPPLHLAWLDKPNPHHLLSFRQRSEPNHCHSMLRACWSALPTPSLPFATPWRWSTIGWLILLCCPCLAFTAEILQQANANIRWNACCNCLALQNGLASPLP
jgi:hypothetical protein